MNKNDIYDSAPDTSRDEIAIKGNVIRHEKHMPAILLYIFAGIISYISKSR